MTIGHGVWMSDADIDLIAAAGVRVCHNCSSNMRLASGRAAVSRMVAAGIPVAIGIDEAGLNDDRDMLQEVRLVAVANREPGLDAPRLRAGTVLRMATEHGAATTGFSAAVGRLDVGRAADLLLLDWRHVTYPYQSPLLPAEDVIVHRARSGAVHSAMINGSWVLRDRTFVTVDRAAVLDAVARSLRADLTDAERARIPFAADVECEVRAFYRDYPEPVRVRVHPPAGGMAPADRPGPG
jgi:cytosine/adenosine deaminase-related metal-dependent hydrolase